VSKGTLTRLVGEKLYGVTTGQDGFNCGREIRSRHGATERAANVAVSAPSARAVEHFEDSRA
jgi:hypothetical protein